VTPIIHLHNHSVYSANDALCTPGELVKKAVELKMPAVALTEHGTMFSIPELVNECKKVNKAAQEAGSPPVIRPIIGLEAYLTTSPILRIMGKEKPNVKQDSGHITLLAMNEEGYANLVRLATLGFKDNVYNTRPRIDIYDLARHSEGVLCMTGCMYSWLNIWITRHFWMLRDTMDMTQPEWQLIDQFSPFYNMDADVWEDRFGNKYTDQYLQTVLRNFRVLKAIFGDNLYIELQYHGFFAQRLQSQFWLESFPTEKFVATNDVHYIEQRDWDAWDFLTRIRWRGLDRTYYNEPMGSNTTDSIKGNAYFKTREEMAAGGFGNEALDMTYEIMDKCQFDLKQDRSLFPSVDMKTKAEMDTAGGAIEYLRSLCKQSPNYKPEYDKRIEFELDVIGEMGYPEYFVIVRNLVSFAVSIGATPGPGRGSVGGSIVAYLLGIHNANPIEAGLKFFRFLNKERISMPDIDLDFPKEKRQAIIQYLIDTYGTDRVCNIGTASRNQAKGCIQDFGRIAGIDKPRIDAFNATLDDGMTFAIMKDEGDKKISQLKSLLEESTDLPESYTADDRLRLLETAEGSIRSYGKHASGIVVCSRPLDGVLPLFRNKLDDPLCTQYDMNALDDLGFCKIDVLGLKQMDVLNECFQRLGIDRNQVDMNDQDALDLINEANTIGLFQLGTPSFIKIIKAGFRCHNIMDITALNALNRPGPKDYKDERGMTMIDHYVQRQTGNEDVEFLHPALRPILGDTFGVMIYQEQIMMIARQIAGYRIGEADDLRKFCGKKLTENMTPEQKEEVTAPKRNKFVQGCMSNAIPQQVAETLWKQIETFGRYGFNKSHSYFYAMLAMWGAWLKAHYPTTFLGACLKYEDKEENRIKLIDDIRKHSRGLELANPHINISSTYVEWDEDAKRIYLGLSDVKQVATGVAEALVSERMLNGPFVSLPEMVSRLNTYCTERGEHMPDKGSMARLALVGAFNDLVPGPEEGRSEYACSLLTSERLPEKFQLDVSKRSTRKTKKPTVYIENFVDRHESAWVRLMDLGININREGLLAAVRANKNRKAQADLFEIAKTWDPVAVLDDPDGQALFASTEQQLFGYDPTRRSVENFDVPAKWRQISMPIEQAVLEVVSGWSRKDCIVTIGIVGHKIDMRETSRGTPMLEFYLENSVAETRCAFYGDTEKRARLAKIIAPGEIVAVKGWPRPTYFAIESIKKAINISRKVKAMEA